MEALRIEKKTVFPGAPDIAEKMLSALAGKGLHCARTGPVKYGNNRLMPWVLMEIGMDPCPAVLIFINVFTPPLIPYWRAYAFGEAVRDAVETALLGYEGGVPRDGRIVALAAVLE